MLLGFVILEGSDDFPQRKTAVKNRFHAAVQYRSRRARVKAVASNAVVDQYQGQGVGAALTRHLTILARAGGFEEFVAEVLPENTPMLRVFEKSGLAMKTKRDGGTIKVRLRLTSIAT
jgi:ribosomal protein S18 acetylase RimI-like enzyme